MGWKKQLLVGLGITALAVGGLETIINWPSKVNREAAKYECVLENNYHSTRSDDPGLLALKECYKVLDVEDECRPTSSSLNCKDAARNILDSLKSDKESLGSKPLKESDYLDLAREIFQLESKMDNYLRFDLEHRAFYNSHASTEEGFEESLKLAQEGVKILNSLSDNSLGETTLADYLRSTVSTMIDYQLMRIDKEYHEIDCVADCDHTVTLWTSNCDQDIVTQGLAEKYGTNASGIMNDPKLADSVECQREEQQERRQSNYQTVRQAITDGTANNPKLIKLASIEKELISLGTF